MGQVLHGSAATTGAVHRTILNSQESLRALAKRYGSEEGQKTTQWIVFPTNQKTVAKWKKRTSVADVPPMFRRVQRCRSRRFCRSRTRR